MQKTPTKRALATILADIANLPPFLPGSIRKGGVQRHRNKAGKMVEYKAMPRLHYRRNGQWVDKRFHESLWETMKELTSNYKKFKKLIAEFEEAVLQENLPDKSKKN